MVVCGMSYEPFHECSKLDKYFLTRNTLAANAAPVKKCDERSGLTDMSYRISIKTIGYASTARCVPQQMSETQRKYSSGRRTWSKWSVTYTQHRQQCSELSSK